MERGLARVGFSASAQECGISYCSRRISSIAARTWCAQVLDADLACGGEATEMEARERPAEYTRGVSAAEGATLGQNRVRN